jgi:hypothetical protein
VVLLRTPFIRMSPPVSRIKDKEVNASPILGILFDLIQMQDSLVFTSFLQLH